MPDLFTVLPLLGRASHPLLADQRIALVGVSAVLYDHGAFYFEVNRPRHWERRADGTLYVGIAGIGGRVEAGESPLVCLRREVDEELGVGFRLEVPERTALIHQWQVAGWLDLPPSRKHPIPYFVTLLQPRLGERGRLDHDAILTFRGRPQGRLLRRDLFGLLTVARSALKAFFARAEWPLEEALAHPDLSFDLEADLPTGCALRPVLTARALQVLVQHGMAPE